MSLTTGGIPQARASISAYPLPSRRLPDTNRSQDRIKAVHPRVVDGPKQMNALREIWIGVQHAAHLAHQWSGAIDAP